MDKKIAVLLIILVAIAAYAIFHRGAINNIPRAIQPNVSPINAAWIDEGAIYETHPYYYNGKFQDIIPRIPDIANLGVKTIYLLPIWEHVSGYPSQNMIYLIKDYYKIDSAYGTDADLKQFVDTVHANNMKIVFDFVTCCTFRGSQIYNNKWILTTTLTKLKNMGVPLSYWTKDGVQYVYSNCSWTNGIPDKCDVFGEPIGDEVRLGTYPTPHFGYAVDRGNPEVISFFNNVSVYYMKTYGIDGFRVDAPGNQFNPKMVSSDHSSLTMLRDIKQAITNIKPDAVLFTESASPGGDVINSDPMFYEVAEIAENWPLYAKLSTSILSSPMPSPELVNFLQGQKVLYDGTRAQFVEIHDTARVNIIPGLSRPGLVLISTIPGVPFIQAGQEIGARNCWFAPGCTGPKVDWANGDYALRDFYRNIFEIRNNHPALKYTGSESISNVWKAGDNIYAYSRTYGNDTVIVVINFNSKESTSILELPLKAGTTLYDELNTGRFTIGDPANFQMTVPAHGSRILATKG